MPLAAPGRLSDQLRDQIAERGFTVVDTSEGTQLETTKT